MLSNNGSSGAAWKALKHDRLLQFDFPDVTPESQPPGWLKTLVKWLAAHGEWFRYAGWGLLALLVLAGLWWFVTYLRKRGPNRTEASRELAVPQWQPSPERARLLLADADALAARGQFGEAAHLLLLVSIQEIAERRPGLVRRALTSREIANRPELSAQAREVFALIAAVVEHAIFGNHAIAVEDFGLCRRAFEQFTVPSTWKDAA
jgi:hypothetical protein